VGVFTGVTGALATSPHDLRHQLALQLSRPIRWDLVVQGLLAQGARTFVEIGPGRMLTGLLAQMSLPVGVRGYFLERPDGKSSAFREELLRRLPRPRPVESDEAIMHGLPAWD
jgi:acyl transferase domain-containing protein